LASWFRTVAAVYGRRRSAELHHCRRSFLDASRYRARASPTAATVKTSPIPTALCTRDLRYWLLRRSTSVLNRYRDAFVPTRRPGAGCCNPFAVDNPPSLPGEGYASDSDDVDSDPRPCHRLRARARPPASKP